MTITPALIAVAPTIESTGTAAVNVEPIGITVPKPPGAPGK